MIELYFGPGACSFVPHVALEVVRAATGTAHTSRAGARARTACSAAIIVAPVASPSSTTIATRPAGSMSARAGVYDARRARRVAICVARSRSSATRACSRATSGRGRRRCRVWRG